MKSSLQSRSSGYTLIELLIVVAITVIISGSLISFNSLGQDQVTLYVETSKVVDVILRAKSLAISAYRDPNITRSTCAHGIFIDTTSNPGTFSLNRYLKKEGATPTPCSRIGETGSLISNYDRVVAESSTYVLSKGLVFDPVETTVGDVIFRPPDPQIFYFKPDGSFLSAINSTIVIKSPKGRMRITVGQGGQITYNFID